MSHSNLHFLEKEYPILYNIGQSAEFNLHSDPVITLIKLRLFGEKLTEVLFDEHGLEFPKQNNFYSRVKTLEFERILPSTIKDFLFTIKDKGNVAAHDNKGTEVEGRQVLFSTFKVAKWFYQTYSNAGIDISELKFQIPESQNVQRALSELELQYKALEERFNKLLEERESKGITKEKQKEIQERSKVAVRRIEWTEAETRELIDAQLRLAGWEVDSPNINYKLKKTLPQKGKNFAIAEWPVGSGWADYALFIGTELYALAEAKKYDQDISTNLRQSKIYAESVEEVHGSKLLGDWRGYKAPFLFSTNGREYLEQIETKSGVWFLDVRNEYNNSRALHGWYSPDGLKDLWLKDVQQANEKLQKVEYDFLKDKSGLNLRDYQIDAIKAVEKEIVERKDRKRSLIAMATGTGKTRTIIGLCYHLIQTNRFKRILFLIDRTLLGIQAINAFKDNKIDDLNTFSEIYDVRGLKDSIPNIDTRLHFATVQGMIKRLFYNEKDKNIPPIDQYDCIIVDEAHRGYLLDKELSDEDFDIKDQMDYVSKYRKVLDYFDSYAVGLTATPALHTTQIFGLPIYTYSYRDAVIDGYLIDHDPPYLIKTKLSEKGIKWLKGERPKVFDKEANKIIELATLEDELSIDIEGFNKLVLTENFNRTVAKYLVQHLDPESEEKTLIFCATDEHADNVVKILKEEFVEIGIDVNDDAIQKITGASYKPEELFKRYKNEKYPNIAVTVDLLTTGIDVPSICNLVFLRRVKSRILYEQMLGRATRRCDDIGKETFRIYDAVRLYEALKDYTQMKPVVVNPNASFIQLAEECPKIQSNEKAKKHLEEIIAKLQRKRRRMSDHHNEQFKYYAGSDPETFIHLLSTEPLKESIQKIIQTAKLWKYLDELKPTPGITYVSEHGDELTGVERGYGKAKKPEDYLESFSNYIKVNRNKIDALNIICTSPKDLNRKALRELLLELDREGFNEKALNTAWKEAKNEEVAADIISFIRTLAVGNSLMRHEDRIKKAVDSIRKMKQWNATQIKWLNRIEKQLLNENVLQKEDFDREPFKEWGGFQKLDKAFNNQFELIINTINENLYTQTA